MLDCSTTQPSPAHPVASLRMSAGWLQAACALPAPQPRTTWFEPVSAAKAVRGVSILAHLDYISPNLDELVAIAAQLCPDRRHAASRSQEAGRPPQDALQHPAHLQGSGTDVRGTAGMARTAVDGVRWAIVALLQVMRGRMDPPWNGKVSWRWHGTFHAAGWHVRHVLHATRES